MSTNPNEERDRRHELMKQHAAQLAEHFDNVQIFCNSLSADGAYTENYDHGLGNFYAHVGQVRDWLKYHDSVTHARALTDQEDKPEIGGDDGA